MGTVTDITLAKSNVSPGESNTATVTLESNYGWEKCDVRVSIPGVTTIGYKSGINIQGTTTTTISISSVTDPGTYDVCADTEDCEILSP